MPYSRLSVVGSRAHDPLPNPNKQRTDEFIPERGLKSWASTLWPLVLHCVVAIGIVVLMVYYVNGRNFNVTERKPWVPLADGTSVQLSQRRLLQSDVVAILSGALVILRLIAASWGGSLCWRIAFFLLEKTGLRYRDLDWLISYGCFPPTYDKHLFAFRIGLILLVTLSAQVASPILTGSITWQPINSPVGLHSDATVYASVTTDRFSWSDYATHTGRLEFTARQAAGLTSFAWGRGTEKGVLKRVLPSTALLNINSTITNVTLPYFSITAFEWILDPKSLPSEQQNIRSIIANLSTVGDQSVMGLGSCSIIADEPWNSPPFPSPLAVSSRTATVIVTTHWLEPNTEPCRPDNSPLFSRLPPTIGYIQDGWECYMFARVTYSAGVGICNNCRVSSHSTVQNDTALALREDPMTNAALRLMPDTTNLYVRINTSVPSTMSNVDDYVIEVLGRSYSGAWTAITNFLGGSETPLTSSFSPSLPFLQAQVDLKRVYAWLAIQLLLTFSGIIFLWMQAGSDFPLIGDTTLAAFKLDATDVTTKEGDKMLNNGSLLRLELQVGGIKIVVDAVKSVKEEEQVSQKLGI